MILLFLFIPISTILLFFVKDANKNRRINVNFFLIANCLIFLSPLIIAYFTKSTGGNMWSGESGVVLWVYMALLPLCLFFQLILIGLKILFNRKSKI